MPDQDIVIPTINSPIKYLDYISVEGLVIVFTNFFPLKKKKNLVGVFSIIHEKHFCHL